MTDVVREPEWGYLRLDPVPEEDELASFYESGYYDLLRSGLRAPDLARLQKGGREGDREREWLRQTVHRDYLDWATGHNDGVGRVLEVGSGSGELLDSFVSAGWEATGLEPAVMVAKACRARGLDVRSASLEQYLTESPEPQFDVVILRMVLEHVRDPVGLLRSAHSSLRSGGLAIVEVPNDFNPLQHAARQSHGLDQWWIAVPDHINYFDFASLTQLLEKMGFDVVARSSTFPMELFLLMGDNYVGDPETGAACHERRRRLELNLDAEVRRKLYGALADSGLGRTCRLAAVAR